MGWKHVNDNDNGEVVFYPAGYNGVLSVAASEQSDLKKNNSNYVI